MAPGEGNDFGRPKIIIISTTHLPKQIIIIFLALIYMDMKFGLEFADWDTNPEDEETLTGFLKAMATRNLKSYWNIVLIVQPLRCEIVHDALKAVGFRDIQQLTWCKGDAQVMQGITSRWVSATETIIVAHYGTRVSASDAQLAFDPNPLKRYNWFIGPTQKTKLKHLESGGEVVNVYEKPPWLAEFVAGHYVKPGDTCLVFGAGAGGDVKGLLNLGCDVIAFENDKRQMTALCAELMNYEPAISNKVLKMNEVNECIQKAAQYDKAVKRGYHTEDYDSPEEEPAAPKTSKKRKRETKPGDNDSPKAKEPKPDDEPAKDGNQEAAI